MIKEKKRFLIFIVILGLFNSIISSNALRIFVNNNNYFNDEITIVTIFYFISILFSVFRLYSNTPSNVFNEIHAPFSSISIKKIFINDFKLFINMLVYMKFIILLLSILCIVSGYSTNKPRVWERIPQYFVSNRVVGFLNENRITNCFEYVETETNLLLKCWRDNKLTDVSIEINPSKKEQQLTFMGLSVSI